MTETRQANPTRDYLIAFVVLLLVTAVEASVVVVFSIAPAFRVTILVICALTKASLIGAYYMNLKFERLAMVYIAAIPLILGILMFFAIVPDAASVFGLH